MHFTKNIKNLQYNAHFTVYWTFKIYIESSKYIAYLTKKGTSKKTINHRLRIVKNYLNYLVEEGNRSDNPIENTVVKGEQRTIHHNLLSSDELEDLYYSYEVENHKRTYHKYTALRARAIVGLLVYQGIGTTDLGNLQTEHLQLNKGKIYVPSTKKSNARELELKAIVATVVILLVEFLIFSSTKNQFK